LIAFWCFVVAHLEWPDMENILASGAVPARSNVTAWA